MVQSIKEFKSGCYLHAPFPSLLCSSGLFTKALSGNFILLLTSSESLEFLCLQYFDTEYPNEFYISDVLDWQNVKLSICTVRLMDLILNEALEIPSIFNTMARSVLFQIMPTSLHRISLEFMKLICQSYINGIQTNFRRTA